MASGFHSMLDFQAEPETLAAAEQPMHLLLSSSLRHSHTFALYAEVLARVGSRALFLPFEVQPEDQERLNRLMAVFRSSRWIESIMVSHPFKQRVQPFLDICMERAAIASAVNLLTKAEGNIVGDNLDGIAFEQGLQEMHGITLAGCSLLFLGCGGVSSAVATQMGAHLSRIGLADVEKAKAEALRSVLSRCAPGISVEVIAPQAPRNLHGFDVLYNGTGLGKAGTAAEQERTPLQESERTTASLFLDAVYTPAETRFLRQGTARGGKAINGLAHMLASTALHCSVITGQSISWQLVWECYGSRIWTS